MNVAAEPEFQIQGHIRARPPQDLVARLVRWRGTQADVPNHSDGIRRDERVISMMLAEAEPIGAFAGAYLSEPLLQGGMLLRARFENRLDGD